MSILNKLYNTAKTKGLSVTVVLKSKDSEGNNEILDGIIADRESDGIILESSTATRNYFYFVPDSTVSHAYFSEFNENGKKASERCRKNGFGKKKSAS